MAFLFRVIAIVLLVLAVKPTSAQDDALDAVIGAYNATLAVERYQIDVEQTTSQQFVSGNGAEQLAFVQSIERSITGSVQITDEALVSSMVMSQEQLVTTGDEPQILVEYTLEIVSVDGDVYLRFSDFRPAENAAMIPTGWFEASDPSQFPGSAFINTDSLVNLARINALYPLNADTITEIEALDGEMLDEMPMDVFDLVLDVSAALASQESVLTRLFNYESLGMRADEVLTLIGDSTQITMRVWVGEADGLIHQLDTRLNLRLDLSAEQAGGQEAVLMEQETTSLSRLYAFNEPVEISVPVLEQ